VTAFRVALVQLQAGDDVAANLERAAALGEQAAASGARLVAFPEWVHFRGPDDGFRSSAEPIPGPSSAPFQQLARGHGCWVLAGTLAEASGDSRRPYNTSALVAPDGQIQAIYRKLHLFDIAVDAGPADTESARATAGDAAVVADVEGVALGLSICYDLRFPELYRALALAGAQVLAVPSVFTERTGRDHWEVLLRARAIEAGAFVIAPAQFGRGVPDGIPAFGRSMVVDPWGTVIAQAPDGEGIVIADLDLDRVTAVRRQIPVLANLRPDALPPQRPVTRR